MGLTGIGGLIGATGAEAQGKYAEQIAQYRATQDTINAASAQAASQRQALDSEQRTRLTLSSLRARGAASGVNLTSPSAVGAAEAIGGRGAYQAGMELWQGQNQAAGYQTSRSPKFTLGRLRLRASSRSA